MDPEIDRRSTAPVATAQGRGRLAESIAAAYYELRGYEVLKRNYRDGPRELDLLVARGAMQVVVEVRFRASVRCGEPEETIRWRKRRDLRAAGHRWWLERGTPGMLRFDLVTLTLTPDGLALRHHPNFLKTTS